MSAKLVLHCDGCDATHDVGRVSKSFQSFSGRSHGFGVWVPPDIDKLVEPTRWQWSDPYTSCCYCPHCWEAITSDADAMSEVAS